MGDTVLIQRAGDVIPQVLNVDTSKRGKSSKKFIFPDKCLCGSITIKEISYKKIKVAYEKKLKNHSWLIFKLKEGKNREIRNICNYFSWNIVKLIRIGYGPYKLGRLKEGQFQKLNSISK